jgi:hypothetical protein
MLITSPERAETGGMNLIAKLVYTLEMNPAKRANQLTETTRLTALSKRMAQRKALGTFFFG